MSAPELATKTCTKCGVTKPMSEFHRERSKRDGLRSQCKECVRDKSREDSRRLRSTEEGRELANARRRESYRRNPTTARRQREAYAAAVSALVERHRREFDALYRIEAHARGFTAQGKRSI